MEAIMPTQDEVNEYLDALRESSITNMYGAPPYVQREFGISIKDARAMTLEWMHTFGERHPKEA